MTGAWKEWGEVNREGLRFFSGASATQGSDDPKSQEAEKLLETMFGSWIQNF